MIFSRTLSIYIGRINLSTAIVEMVYKAKNANKTKVIVLNSCGIKSTNSINDDDHDHNNDNGA